MPTQPTEYLAVSLNCQWPWFASTRAGVADGTIQPWSRRLPKLVKIIQTTGCSVVMAQELGHDESAQLAASLGERWQYQRYGLAAVLWRDDWKLQEEPGRDDVSRDWQLPSYNQDPDARTLIACRLVHQTTGQYFFAASCHFASTGAWGLGSVTAATGRYRQAKFAADKLHKYSAVLLAGDFNSRGSLPGTPRSVMAKDGWTFTEPKSYLGDPHKGIDAVGAKKRVTVKAVSVLPLGSASDHSGRLIRFSITSPAPKD